MTSTFTVVTPSSHAAERLFDLSLSIDEHLGSMADSGEQAIDGVTSGGTSPLFGRLAERLILVPYLRRLIRQRNRHLLAVLDAAATAQRQKK
ncbi:hypothetical protein LG293_13445 [Citricoccus nitrophenolicus]|uniref:Uncharacterized protein n=1 Tax=Citricoccus muralis TaxID=169134 RepID=A0A3D9LAU9_9MICC|nr:hypothetical protein [Citricoccus muralis]REE02980.1 hypothetical protein C8E99_0775 [Citricoccus muralis]